MTLLAALGSRPFALYSAANGAAFAAAWMQRLALGWAVWTLTHSGLWLGLLAICDLGPALLFGPIGGVLGDRGHPLRVIAWSQAAVVAMTLVAGLLIWLEAPVWTLLLAAIVGGAAVALEDAPRAAIVTALAPPAAAGQAVALTAVIINLARFVGPALGGAIAALMGLVPIFAVAALAGVPLIAFAARARVVRAAARAPQHWLRDLGDSLAYARTHRLIGMVLLNFLLSSLFARATYELIPGLANGLFHQDIGGLSAMTTALGLGAVAAGLWMMRGHDADRAARISFGASLAAGAVVIALAIAPVFAFALAVSALLGFSVSMAAIAAQIVLQLGARGDMRTRMLSLWSMIIRAGPATGALILGYAADRLGFRPPLAVAGAAAAGCAMLCWLAFRPPSATAA